MSLAQFWLAVFDAITTWAWLWLRVVIGTGFVTIGLLMVAKALWG